MGAAFLRLKSPKSGERLLFPTKRLARSRVHVRYDLSFDLIPL
jgi:hypothetical protein